MATKERKRTYNKKPKLNSQIGKYFMAKKTGKTTAEAKAIAEYSPKTQSTDIENTKTYLALEQKHYKDVLAGKISLEEIADIQIRNLKQERDLGASNKASELLLEGKGEKNNEKEIGEEKVIIIFKDTNININKETATESQLEGNQAEIEEAETKDS